MVTPLQSHAQLAQLGIMNQQHVNAPSAKVSSEPRDGDGDHGVETRPDGAAQAMSAAATGLGRHVDVRA